LRWLILEEFAVGTEASQFESFCIGLAIDKYKIRPYMAIAEPCPDSAEGMVAVTWQQWSIGREQI
jgi:hypothetical protein